MSADPYLGLTTLEAGVFAIFTASFFVLLQTASDLFSPLTPHFLLRRRAALIAVAASFTLFAAGTIASVRVAFPGADLIRGDQRTGVLLTDMWPALVFATLIIGSVLGNLFVLVRLIADLRGPGLVAALADQTKQSRVNDWLDLTDPPQLESPSMSVIRTHQAKTEEDGETHYPYARGERVYQDQDELNRRIGGLRLRHERGELSDPLAPLFEVAAHSIEGRRYALVDRTLNGVRLAVDHWLSEQGDEIARSKSLFALLIEHLDDLVEVAVHSGSQSQLHALVRVVEAMAVDAFRRHDHSYAILLSSQLVHWIHRLETPGYEPTVTATIHAIFRIGKAGFDEDDIHAFEQGLLDLARVAEMLGQRYETQRGLHLLERNVATAREDKPTDALENTVFWMTELFTDRKRQLRGNVVLVSDALYICTRSFLEAPCFDERAAEIARSFFGELGDLALTAAKSLDRDALWKTVYDMGASVDVPQFLSEKILRDSLAWKAFHVGMLAEHNYSQMKTTQGIGLGDDTRDRIADLCIRSGDDALREAVLGLFDRGHTMYIPSASQEAFLERVERRSGWQLNRY